MRKELFSALLALAAVSGCATGGKPPGICSIEIESEATVVECVTEDGQELVSPVRDHVGAFVVPWEKWRKECVR